MKYELNVETGQLVVRNLTDEETAQQALDRQEFEDRAAEENLKEETEAALVESARDKLKALGLSEEEVNAILGPGPVVVTDVVNLDPATEEPAPVEDPAPVEEPVADEAAE